MDWKRARKETRKRPESSEQRWWWLGSGWERWRIDVTILETEMTGLVMMGWMRREEG